MNFVVGRFFSVDQVQDWEDLGQTKDPINSSLSDKISRVRS